MHSRQNPCQQLNIKTSSRNNTVKETHIACLYLFIVENKKEKSPNTLHEEMVGSEYLIVF